MIINGYGLLDSLNRVAGKNKKEDTTMQKVSSGKRIVKAADDAGGLSISESFKSQIRGLSQGERNCQDATSMLQVVDGALGEVTESLHRMKEISVQAANDTLTDEDREKISTEFENLKKGISDIAEQTEFNGIKILNSDKHLTIQIKDTPYTTYDINLKDMSAESIGIKDSKVSNSNEAQESLKIIDQAALKISDHRTRVGAYLSNLEHTATGAANNGENLTASLSRVEDIDMANGMMKIVKNDILANCNSILFASVKQSAENVHKIMLN